MSGSAPAEAAGRAGPASLRRGKRGSSLLAIALLWFTLAWNVVEGVVAVSSGVVAGSVALVGFGLDSAIEVVAAAVLIWRIRLPDHDGRAELRERIAHRVVGATFILLGGYILAETAYLLVTGREPGSSVPGLALSIAATVVMPPLGLAKRWNAARLGSRALVAEATESLVCSYLSLTLFVGLAANAAFGWWWADIVAALAMVPWIVKEGLEGLRGEACDGD
jgi:divalent metal cation (Fe/Co/Zn/Cd) transporter